MRTKDYDDLPNLIIIGAAKSGTSSLHYYLSQHPDIFMSANKELRFFVPEAQGGRYHFGLDWYKRQFRQGRKINGETSPQYSLHPKIIDIPARIKNTLVSPKIIYIMRDPIDRILSDYLQIVDEEYPVEDFDSFIAGIESTESFLYSRYHLQIVEYLKVFQRRDILLLISERLGSDPKKTLSEVFAFLDVKSDFWVDDFSERRNARDRAIRVAPWFDRYAPGFLKKQLREPDLRSKVYRLYRLIHYGARIGGVRLTKPTLRANQDKYLQSLFASDVKGIRELMSDPIPEWRPYNR